MIRLSREHLAELAQMLRVDEVRTFSMTRNAIGFILTIPPYVEVMEIELDNEELFSLNLMYRKLSVAATRLNQRVSPVEIEWDPLPYAEFMDYTRRSIASVFGMTREQLGLDEPELKPSSRFHAVLEEIERIK